MDNTDLFKSVIASLVRHSLTGLAGALVAKGLITAQQGEGLIVAAAAGAIGIAWALYNKWKVGQKIQVALDLPRGSTPAALDAAVAKKEDKP